MNETKLEQQHDKSNKMTCAPSKDSNQPGHPPSLISLRCPHEEALGPKLPRKRTAKTLFRLGRCLGWSESLLGAQVILFVLTCCSSKARAFFGILHTSFDYSKVWVCNPRGAGDVDTRCDLCLRPGRVGAKRHTDRGLLELRQLILLLCYRCHNDWYGLMK